MRQGRKTCRRRGKGGEQSEENIKDKNNTKTFQYKSLSLLLYFTEVVLQIR